MKVLTVCEQGLNRSVTAKWLVQHRGHEVIAAGTATLSEATLEMLYAWADRIIVLDQALLEGALLDNESKVWLWNVGPDHYEHHYNPELVAALRHFDAMAPWLGAHTRGG